MSYLLLHTWIWVLLAFLFGVGMGWILRNMSSNKDKQLKDK